MYHKLIIAGNLGGPPTMRYTPGGKAVTDFSLASNRVYYDSAGEKIKETCWFRVSVWGKQAENANQYLQKGSKVLVEGYLRPDTNGNPRVWHKDDGTAAASYDMTALNVTFLDSKRQNGDEEEIPF